MKTSEEWREEIRRDISPERCVNLIERIQRDALSDPMANTTDQQELEMAQSIAANERIRADQLHEQLMKLKERFFEQRSYLRAANRGAERNHTALQLAIARHHNTINSDKRWKERDERNHKTVIWNWLCLSDEDLRLKLGELTNPEVRTIRSLLKAMLGTSILRL